MFTIWFTEGGRPLSEREWSIVPRVGDNITFSDSTGQFEVIRVNWEERDNSPSGLVVHVSLRAMPINVLTTEIYVSGVVIQPHPQPTEHL